MENKKIVKIFFVLILLILFLFISYSFFFKKKTTKVSETVKIEETISSSNIIQDVNYTTRDADGNEYIVTAAEGEIDYSNSSILFLTNVKAEIKLKNLNIITITSDFGKYNTDNFDTIFSKNVIITYLENIIKGKYLDFSLERSSMIISKDVVYTNLDNVLKADVIEIDIKTKDTKIFMYEETKKVNINNN